MVRGLRSLANFFDAASDSWRIPWKGKPDFLDVQISPSTGYRQRTIRNATDSDVTISVARDFDSAGERLTRNSVRQAGRPHVELRHASDTFDADVAATVAKLNEVAAAKGGQPIVINAAGNGLSTLRANQDVPDLYAMRLMRAVLQSPERSFEVAQLRSGGQTGYDIAFIKAALANDIPAKIYAARGRGQGGILVRRRNGRDAELSLEEYLDELQVDQVSIQSLVDKMTEGVEQAVAAQPLRRINLDEPTVADVELQKRLLQARGRDKPKDALEAAITEEQARILGLTETQRRQIDVEKGEQSSAIKDVERLRRGAIERMRRGRGGGEGSQYVSLEDVARYAPELLDDRPTFDMDVEIDRQFVESAKGLFRDVTRQFTHNTKPATEMPVVHRFTLDGVRDIIEEAFTTTLGGASDETLGILEQLDSYGPSELRAIIDRVMRSDLIDDAIKAKFTVTDYYSSVAKMDSYFPVVPVTTRTGTTRLTATGLEQGTETVSMRRVLDPNKFEGASPEELQWLEESGARTASLFLHVISGRFHGKQEKALLLRAARRQLMELSRVRKQRASAKTEEIDEFFSYLNDKALNTSSMFSPLPAGTFARPTATRFQQTSTATPRITITLRGRQGEPVVVDFQWNEATSSVMPGNIKVNGEVIKKNALDVLEDLFEVDASYNDLLTGQGNPYHRFELAYRRPDGSGTENLLGRELSLRGIKFEDGESVLDKFILDVLGYRGNADGLSVNDIIIQSLATRKVEKRGGKEIVTWIPKKTQTLRHAVTGEPAKVYANQFAELIDSATQQGVNAENLQRLSEVLGRRQLSSSWDVQLGSPELSVSYVLNRLLSARGLRSASPTRRIQGSRVEEVAPQRRVFARKEDMPQDGPMTDDEIWYAYRVGEVREMPAEMIESVIGIRRTSIDEEAFLMDQEIARPFRHMIVRRVPEGRQFRPRKEKTESQRAGRIVARTDEEKEILRAKLTDEYGLRALTSSYDEVDILRKPGSSRHFGNPYHIDDAANIIQRVHANTKFEYYLLNGSRVEEFSPGLGRMVVYDHASWMRRNLWRLRGKKLSCVCGSRYCHGEVLLQYAESTDIGRLIDRYGDDPARLSDMVERALLQHGRATRRDFESYISRFERQYQDQLTTLPTDVTYRVQADDLFIERINPRTDIGPTQG